MCNILSSKVAPGLGQTSWAGGILAPDKMAKKKITVKGGCTDIHVLWPFSLRISWNVLQTIFKGIQFPWLAERLIQRAFLDNRVLGVVVYYCVELVTVLLYLYGVLLCYYVGLMLQLIFMPYRSATVYSKHFIRINSVFD